MHTSTIYVRHGDRSGGSGVKVALGFPGGVTETFIADRYGVAEVEHDSTGYATIFVNGRRQGTMVAPGEASVTL
ncbi:MAG TPA: hypothetical protein VNP72_06155 [Longimicrobium sp.]|nr:hypothetical protein [Longimicrobium sp.]